jgi:mannose-6-phosphate isomerase-like protein (cupin superfamily)
MAERNRVSGVVEGEGYAVGHIDAMGDGYGFRKVRRALGVSAFGINALVLPPRYEAPAHYHERQEETYFVHRGEVEIEFGDGTRHLLGPGGTARVDAPTSRRLRNLGSEDAIVLIAGGAGGYVGRDGQPAAGERGRSGRPLAGGEGAAG